MNVFSICARIGGGLRICLHPIFLKVGLQFLASDSSRVKSPEVFPPSVIGRNLLPSLHAVGNQVFNAFLLATVCEQDIPRTFMLMWTVQRAAEIQCQAGMLPGRNVTLSDKVRGHCTELIDHLVEDASFATKMFDAMVRRMRCERGALWPGDGRQRRQP